MKKVIYLMLAFTAMTSCNSPLKQIEIQGTVDDTALNDKKVYLFDNWNKTDSTVISNNKFSFKADFDSVKVYNIGIEGKRFFDVVLAEQSGVITIEYEKGVNHALVNDEGRVNSIRTDAAQTIKSFLINEGGKLKRMRENGTPSATIDSIMKENRKIVGHIWRETALINAENLAGAATFAENYTDTDSKEFLDLYEKIKYASLFPQLKDREQVCENLEKTKEGEMFVDFKGEDLEGKETTLSNFVGKGKYILVDFWASWCGPCRAEIPNIINVYKKFSGDRFTVIGVDLWDQKDKFKKAVEEEGIEYPQIFAADNKEAGTLYGIESIPHIILFGPDGKILKRGLRGEAILQTVKDELEK